MDHEKEANKFPANWGCQATGGPLGGKRKNEWSPCNVMDIRSVYTKFFDNWCMQGNNTYVVSDTLSILVEQQWKESNFKYFYSKSIQVHAQLERKKALNISNYKIPQAKSLSYKNFN